MPSGLNTETFTKLLSGTAIVSIATVPIGVTRGTRCEIGTVIRNVPFDGKVADIAGLDRIVGYVTRITGTFLQFGAADRQRVEHGVAGVLVGSVTTTTPKVAQEFFVTGSYVTDLQFDLLQADGDKIRIELPKAYCVYSIGGGAADDEAGVEVSFEARQEP